MNRASRASSPAGGPSAAARRAGAVDAVRRAALRILIDLDENPFPAGGRIEQIEASFSSPEERHLFHSLISELLRHRLRLDAILDAVLTRQKMEELPPPIRAALRLGAVQLLLLTGVPAHAAVDTSVSLARLYGHEGTAGLVNAVLRRLAREGRTRWTVVDAPPIPEGPEEETVRALSIRFSHPPWMVRRFLSRWGRERTAGVLAWDNSIPDYWVRLRPDPAHTLPVLSPAAVPGWIPGTARFPAGSRPAEMPEFARGDWTIQDGSAILAGQLPPEVMGLVLDLCAAPGTKTGHLLERGSEGAWILACDLSAGRLRRLARGLARGGEPAAGSARVLLVAADGRRIPLRPPWNGVLVDAPCSNLGVMRRRLDLRWRAREEEIARLAAVQAGLLEAAASGVAANGWLVYSVCTLEPEETTAQRERFFREHGDWDAVELPEAVPEAARGRPGEMTLVPGELETDGTYAFVARRNRAAS